MPSGTRPLRKHAVHAGGGEDERDEDGVREGADCVQE